MRICLLVIFLLKVYQSYLMTPLRLTHRRLEKFTVRSSDSSVI